MIEFQTMQQGIISPPSPSPSFSSYSSSETLAEIAARVIEELRRDPHSLPNDDAFLQPWENDNNNNNTCTVSTDKNDHEAAIKDNDDEEEEEEEFEFSFVSRDPNTSPVSADDIFYNGQIRPMYPIFDRTLLFNEGNFSLVQNPLNDAVSSFSPIPNTNKNDESETRRRRRLPLRKLMFEERETASCSSSTSEPDDSVDLEGVAEGTYCVWNPNSVRVKERSKSSSTGSVSKRWKLRDLILRSHSEGKEKEKEKTTFQVPSKRTNKVANATAKPNSGHGDGNGDDGALVEKNRTVGTERTKKKSKELLGLFSNVNGLGRTLHPF